MPQRFCTSEASDRRVKATDPGRRLSPSVSTSRIQAVQCGHRKIEVRNGIKMTTMLKNVDIFLLNHFNYHFFNIFLGISLNLVNHFRQFQYFNFMFVFLFHTSFFAGWLFVTSEKSFAPRGRECHHPNVQSAPLARAENSTGCPSRHFTKAAQSYRLETKKTKFIKSSELDSYWIYWYIDILYYCIL